MNGSARLLSVLLLLTPRAVWPQGTPVGPEFRVNTYTLNAQYLPAVATDASGNFVVVWASSLQDGSSVGVFGQRYDSSGAPLGAEFRINNFTTNSQSQPAVAAEPSGSFLVVWASTAQDGSGLGIFAQRYDSSGSAVGPEFRVNTYITNAQAQPAAAADAFGNFVVVWSSN